MTIKKLFVLISHISTGWFMMLPTPEGPGTQLSHTRNPYPSGPPFRPCQGRTTSLSPPQFEENPPTRTCSAAATIKASSYAISNQICWLIVYVQTLTPSRSASLKQRRRRKERIDFLMKVKSDAKAIHLKSCSYASRFPKTDLVTKRQLICAETNLCLKPIYLFKADSKIS
jgi:hypothetical protein